MSRSQQNRAIALRNGFSDLQVINGELKGICCGRLILVPDYVAFIPCTTS